MKTNRLLLILTILVALILIGGGIFIFVITKHRPATNHQLPPPGPTTASTTTATSTLSDTTATSTLDYYGLFIPAPKTEYSQPIQYKYVDYGTITSGQYSGYHRVVALHIEEGIGASMVYTIFITKDYKTFYFVTDPISSNTYSNLNDKKVIGKVSNIPLIHPETIDLGNFILVRQNAYNADSFENYKIDKKIAAVLPSTDARLKFYTQPLYWGDTFGGENSAKSTYVSGVNQIQIEDTNGLLFNYRLLSKENYARQVKSTESDGYYANPFYVDTDFTSGFARYSSYDMLLPGGCGAILSTSYVLKNITDNDLVPIGNTKRGVQLYTLKNQDHPLNKAEYESKIKSVYESPYAGTEGWGEQLNHVPEPSYGEYVANNPIIIMKDPYDRFLGVGEFQFIMPGGCGKPVVCLYPEKPTEVKVTLEKQMTFTTTIPTYSNGWKILAKPDGTLTDLQPQATNCDAIDSQKFGSEYAAHACQNKTYPYLYWAGKVDNLYPQINRGWVVAKDNLTTFLTEKLSFIGLTQKEQLDMLEYWVPELTATNAPYYRISLLETKDLNTFAPMSITPKPDTLIRVFLDWAPLSNNNLKITPQTLTHINRTGFTAVEWGGLKM